MCRIGVKRERGERVLYFAVFHLAAADELVSALAVRSSPPRGPECGVQVPTLQKEVGYLRDNTAKQSYKWCNGQRSKTVL